MPADICANCGDVIGALEEPHIWKENIVCAKCHVKLSAAAPKPVSPLDYRGNPVEDNPRIIRERPGESIKGATDLVVGRVLTIVFLIFCILCCVGVIISKLTG